MGFSIKSHLPELNTAMNDAIERALEICGGKAETYAKRECPVDMGVLRNSITHSVQVDERKAYVGTNTEYAPYVEFGTGQYVSGGRKSPWVYEDARGNWHRTNGQKAQPYLKPSVADHADEYRKIIKTELSQ